MPKRKFDEFSNLPFGTIFRCKVSCRSGWGIFIKLHGRVTDCRYKLSGNNTTNNAYAIDLETGLPEILIDGYTKCLVMKVVATRDQKYYPMRKAYIVSDDEKPHAVKMSTRI